MRNTEYVGVKTGQAVSKFYQAESCADDEGIKSIAQGLVNLSNGITGLAMALGDCYDAIARIESKIRAGRQ